MSAFGNLNAIASGIVPQVNPPQSCLLQLSTGYKIAADGSQVPTYADFAGISCQIQALSGSDLRKMDALNIQATYRAVYINGDWEGLDRSAIKGGDLLTTPDARVWLVSQVLEHWDTGWTKLAVILQNGS